MENIREGRYEGDSARYFLELRFDTTDGGIVSGDLFAAGDPPRDYLASFRSSARREDGWSVVAQAAGGQISAGSLTVIPFEDGDDSVAVRLRLDQPLPGLPFGATVAVAVRWVSAAFRVLFVETETEEDVEVPEFATVNGVRASLQDCLSRAGIEVRAAGRPSRINAEAGGWQWNDANVQSLLEATANRYRDPGPRADWQIQVLRLSRSTEPGIYGVMYDDAGPDPRQGCAVFVNEIESSFTSVEEREREIVMTLAHEVGHALNLTHRFERAVGRAGSTSVMNYPQEYDGGGGVDGFWERFTYSFDPDELAFMRHGIRSAVMPGGSPFHSADYWSSAPGGRPVLPVSTSTAFELSLVAPPDGAYFAFGQPIMLEVSLPNISGRTQLVPRGVLDIKAGYLEILVERTDAAGTPRPGEAQAFTPAIQRCLDLTPGRRRFEPGDKPLTRNVSLSFGAGGFAMAEPGGYRLTPVLTIPGRAGGPATVVLRGASLPVWVAYPKTRVDEQHAIRLLQPDVGAFLSLGGGSSSDRAADTVLDIQDERMDRLDDPLRDPLTAALTRILGIYFARSYLRYDRYDGTFDVKPEETKLAAAILKPLVDDDRALRCFDRSTAEATRALARDVWAKA
ncbi:hypothetical protein OWR29_09140 [Actinoplanes sp. Pm04-4]|uniref:Uncharacterized protein n=1 Tax=Paractinoplanes pyxinae TaxID=2997416 RepID=A0ABT4AWV6_9ACTN|nr:hypothetical protein [Actinoplanes pyxinae]MCY1138160.1 hypothetical protein [Actinoplanes pyxinae]